MRLLAEAILTPACVEGTSLKPRHRSRTVLLDFEEKDGSVVRIDFGILRHPRPYSFSKQSHNVIEYYVYDVAAGLIERQKGVNVTRREGKDAD